MQIIRKSKMISSLLVVALVLGIVFSASVLADGPTKEITSLAPSWGNDAITVSVNEHDFASLLENVLPKTVNAAWHDSELSADDSGEVEITWIDAGEASPYDAAVTGEYTFYPVPVNGEFAISREIQEANSIKVVVSEDEPISGFSNPTDIYLFVDEDAANDNANRVIYAAGQKVVVVLDAQEGAFEDGNGNVYKFRTDLENMYSDVAPEEGAIEQGTANYPQFYTLYGGWADGTKTSMSANSTESTHIIIGETFTGYFKSVYAGNESGAFYGNTTIEVYGGGIYTRIVGGNESGSFYGNSSILIDAATLEVGSSLDDRGVYGGNYNGYFEGNTSIEIKSGMISSGVLAGGNCRGSFVGDTTIKLSGANTKINNAVYGGNANGDGQSEGIYDDSSTFTGNSVITIDSIGEADDIYGGNGHGNFYGTSKIEVIAPTGSGGLDGGVYGGGNHSDFYGDTDVRVYNSTKATSAFGGCRYGDVHGNTKVRVENSRMFRITGAGEYGSVLKHNGNGGNVDLYIDGCQGTLSFSVGDTTYYGIKEVSGGAYQGASSVPEAGNGSVEGELRIYIDTRDIATAETVIQTMYAGTFNAGPDTKINDVVVEMDGGVFQRLYGGSCYGTSAVGKSSTESAVINMNDGYVRNLYAGGGGYTSNTNGDEVGTAELNILGGKVAFLFSGGFSAGNTVDEVTVNVDGGEVETLYSGGYNKSHVEAATINVESGSVITLFGGGRDAASVKTSAINISGGKITGSVYLGGESAAANATTSVESAALDFTGGEIVGEIYLGGRTISAAAIADDSTSGTVVEKAAVNMNGGTLTSNKIIAYGATEERDVANVEDMVITVSKISALGHRFYFTTNFTEALADGIVNQTGEVASYVVLSESDTATWGHNFLDPYKLSTRQTPPQPATYTVGYTSEGTVSGMPQNQTGILSGASVTVGSAPTREGYVFKGWSGNGGTYNPGETFTMPAANVVFSAIWEEENPEEPKSYTVSYNGNGAQSGVPSDSGEYEAGDTVTVIGGTPVKEGFTFIGWEYGGSVYTGGGTFTMPEANVTLTAQWTPDEVEPGEEPEPEPGITLYLSKRLVNDAGELIGTGLNFTVQVLDGNRNVVATVRLTANGAATAITGLKSGEQYYVREMSGDHFTLGGYDVGNGELLEKDYIIFSSTLSSTESYGNIYITITNISSEDEIELIDENPPLIDWPAIDPEDNEVIEINPEIPPKSGIPATGDNSMMAFYVAMLLGSIAIVTVLLPRKSKNRG